MSLHLENPTASLDLGLVRELVTDRLGRFLDEKSRRAAEQGLVPEIPAVLHDFVSPGGKCLRPILCAAGWRVAGGVGVPGTVVDVAAALELYQAFALIHDDVIDNSALRRFRPAVHRAIAGEHPQARDPRRLGEAAAILIGNMALIWSGELLTGAEVPASRRPAVLALVDTMREEMHYGQYLDLFTTLAPIDDQDRPMTVLRYKTAKYTVERPLHVGAALAGAGPELLEVLSRFALPLGDAFQLRDDLLGLFGSSSTTGKPISDDLREGKHTVLLALAAKHTGPAGRAVLDRHVGDPDLTERDAAQAIDVIESSGARELVEDMISERYAKALVVLDSSTLAPGADADLRRIAELLVERES